MNVRSEFTPAFTRLNGIMTVGSIATTADLGAPMYTGVTMRFMQHMTITVRITPITSAFMAVFFVFCFQYIMPITTATIPVATKCMMNP